MSERKVIVIGGGAAGLMAAGQAALAGADTLILEKMGQPGRKLAITGKGRCNITNIAPLSEFISHFGKNGRFLRQAFNGFFAADLINLLSELRVPTETERGGRVFPKSDRAMDVVEALVGWVKICGAKIKTAAAVKKLLLDNDRISGLKTSDGEKYTADAVILATGGASYPGTGSTGDGYALAQSVGHTIIPIRPALVPLVTKGDIAGRLQGLSLRNVAASLWIDGKKAAGEFGEMIFTHYGVSGPIILTLSRMFVDALRERKKPILSIDLKPALDSHQLDQRLLRDLEQYGKRQFQTILKDLLPALLIPVCINLIGIEPDRLANQVTAEERKRLRNWLKDFQFEVSGYRPFEEAIITAGGVNIKEINPRTLESHLIRGLYFAGEVLDVDGDTGGYNLQAAFSTGWLAGTAAALE
jgi:predicted Rossmann fold flavoprotein